jgi:hypothetical protein
MIIQAGPADAVSFTDDTSPNLQRELDRRVSIHAQVMKESLLDWYYDILGLYRDVSGELKSETVLSHFSNLHKETQERIWSGLRVVRINVVDTFPHQALLNESLKMVTSRDNVVEILRRKAQRGDQFAREILKMMDDMTAKLVIEDSPARQFMLYANLLRHPPGSLGWHLRLAEHEEFAERHLDFPLESLSLERFATKKGRSIGKAVKWTSKSASVFYPAIDDLFDSRYSSPVFFQYRVAGALNYTHAFDGGDDQAIGWMEENRLEVLQRIAYQLWCDGISLRPLQGKICSQESYYTQASDIAAGFAKQLFEHGGIVSLTNRFDHVTYNGRRISQADAQEKMRQWKREGYIKEEEKVIYIS